MNVFGLDISWAATANERRYLHWELLTCEQVRGVFPTPRSDRLTVLFGGDRRSFDAWARTLEPDDAFPTTPRPHMTATTNAKGAL